MTTKELYDVVYGRFPQAGERMVAKFVEEGMRSFCQQTHIYQGIYTYSSDGSSVQFKLDTDVITTDKVVVADSAQNYNGTPAKRLVGSPESGDATTSDYVYQVRNGFVLVGTLSDGNYVALPSGKTIVVYTHTVPDTLAAGLNEYDVSDTDVRQFEGVLVDVTPQNVNFVEGQNNVPGIPEQFHMAFAYHAMMMLSEIAGDFSAAQYMNARFAQMVRDGRKWTQRSQQGGMEPVKYYY